MNVLDASALVSTLPSNLPENKNLATPQDGIAALLHTAMVALAFRLVAIDDSSPANLALGNTLPVEWNKAGPSHYTFRYRHDQSSLEFVLKVSKLGSRTLVNAIANESEKTASLDIQTSDFVSPSFFPHDISAADVQPLVHGFISSNRVTDLITQFKFKIIQKLVPGLRKEGYTESVEEDTSSTNAGGSNPNRPSQNQPPARPNQPQGPPHAPENYPRQPMSHLPPDNPLEIGRRDLDPFPANPFQPPSLFPRGSGDGMFVGPDHPIFGSGGGGMRGDLGPRVPWGGDGFLPPMGAPPGARFDPVGPFGPLPGIGGRGRGGPPGGGNMRGPDNDEFMPPGAGDMYM